MMIPIFTLPLEKRFAHHKYNAKNFMRRGCNENNRLYVRMNEIGLGNWEILPLLSRMCGIKTIREVEKNWIRILKADLNHIITNYRQKRIPSSVLRG